MPQRDFLIRQQCPLCSRNDLSSGRLECSPDATDDERAVVERSQVCWWCGWRAIRWAEHRRFSRCYHEGLTEIVMLEFIAEVLQKAPSQSHVWLGNPNAYHPKQHSNLDGRKMLSEAAKRRWRKKKLREAA